MTTIVVFTGSEMPLAPLQPVMAAQCDSARRAAALPPPMKAARKGDVNDVAKLIAQGADVNLEIDGDGNALIAAVRSDNRKMIEYLVSQGADPIAYIPGDDSALVAAVRFTHSTRSDPPPRVRPTAELSLA